MFSTKIAAKNGMIRKNGIAKLQCRFLVVLFLRNALPKSIFCSKLILYKGKGKEG